MESQSTKRMGQYEVRVGFAPPTPEAKARYDRRIDTLSAAIIKVAGITGRIRGMKYKRSDGHTVRPSLVVLEDRMGRRVERVSFVWERGKVRLP